MKRSIASDLQLLLDQKTTKEFLESARKFVLLLEDSTIGIEEFYHKAHTQLLELCLTGHKLEEINLKYSTEDTDFDKILEESVQNINLNRISELGEEAFYWEVDDQSLGNNGESSLGSLVDDFSDIYLELKQELFKIDEIGTEEAIEDGLWQLRFFYYHHWGIHCVSAIHALHQIWYDGKTAM